MLCVLFQKTQLNSDQNISSHFSHMGFKSKKGPLRPGAHCLGTYIKRYFAAVQLHGFGICNENKRESYCRSPVWPTSRAVPCPSAHVVEQSNPLDGKTAETKLEEKKKKRLRCSLYKVSFPLSSFTWISTHKENLSPSTLSHWLIPSRNYISESQEMPTKACGKFCLG